MLARPRDVQPATVIAVAFVNYGFGMAYLAGGTG